MELLEVSNYEEIKIKIELNINSHKMILAPSNENFFSLFKNMLLSSSIWSSHNYHFYYSATVEICSRGVFHATSHWPFSYQKVDIGSFTYICIHVQCS